MRFLDAPTRNLFFTGKGGVGKTSLACTTGIRLADCGKRVLLISTDPASNLDEVLGVPLDGTPRSIPQVPGLFALNLDPTRAAAEYRERMVGPYRELLPAAAIASMEEQFSGSCTIEIAAFDEFSRWLGDESASTEFDHLVFDTAPTGHTLRLLTLPSAWSEFMESNTTGTSCLGPLSGLQTQQQLYRRSVDALADASRTTLILVTRPETAALREAARTSVELAALGVENQHLAVNGVFRAADRSDLSATAWQRRGDIAIEAMPDELNALPRTEIPLAADSVMGIPSLRRFGRPAADGQAAVNEPEAEESSNRFDATRFVPFTQLLDRLAEPGHGLILTMGKGGVGKTTVAAAVAVALAERGHEVHLSTTDPAGHVAATLAGESIAGLTVSRIDPTAEIARYGAQVMESAGGQLDEAGRSLLREDLRSPCTEEIAVFRAFADVVAEGSGKFVVLDTAPTGHTVLLLDAALAYHREVARQSEGMPEAVRQLLPRLRDPDFTRVLIITLPEATPVHEAAALQEDLRRASIEPYAWVINQSLTPLTLTDPLLCSRRSHEGVYLNEVFGNLASRVSVLPWRPQAPVGRSGLNAMWRAAVAEPTN